MSGNNLLAHSLQVRPNYLHTIPQAHWPDTDIGWLRVGDQVFGVDDVRARIGPWHTPWQAVSRFAVPDLETGTDLALYDIMDARAIEIAARARSTGKRIVIMWSGGIDSTAVLASFIKNLDRDDLAKITVCTTTSALQENAFFYVDQIQGRFELLHWYDLMISNDFLSQNILLHGDPGDCIFGPSIGKFRALWPDRQYLKSWKDNQHLLYFLYHDNIQPSFAQWWVDKICHNLHELQSRGMFLKIQSISDWHWWNYYNLKWQGSLTRPLVRNKKHADESIQQQHLDELFELSFFAGVDFQKWSYQNLHRLLGEGVEKHKWEIKQYIYDLDRNIHYRDRMTKQVSHVYNSRHPVILGPDAVHYDFWDPECREAFLAVLER